MLAGVSLGPEPRVGTLMTRHPITIAPNATVEAAAALLKHCRIRHLPVVDGDKLSGVISVRDVLPASQTALVGTVMKQPVLTAAPDESVTAASERLLQRHLSSLPVVDGERLVGIFTATDALRFAEEILRNAAAPVTHLMTANPLVTIDARSTLATAWKLMRDARVRHLPVMSGETLAGILSDRDILAAGHHWLDGARCGNDDAPAMLVADAMTARVLTIAPDRPAAEAAEILLRRRVGALPVLRGRTLVGVLTVSDFLYWILSRP